MCYMKSSPIARGLRHGFRLLFVLVFLCLQAAIPLQENFGNVRAAPAPDPVLAPVNENAEPRPLALAAASVSLGMPANIFLGEDFSFTASFDNTSATATDVGYGPFIDLIFPVTGADGWDLSPLPPINDTDDGIDFSSATYGGNTLTSVVKTFPDADGASGNGITGCVTHPWARNSSGNLIQVCGTAGDKLVSLQLPFGSFVPDQPKLDVTVNAHLSDLADITPAMSIKFRGGYRYGDTPLDDWCCSTTPYIVSATDPDTTTWPGANVPPTVMAFEKSYVGPGNLQDETATGPNFPRQYVMTVDVAAGQTLTNLDISDLLPPNMQFVSIDAANTTTGYSLQSTPSTSTPGGTLTLRYPSVLGTTGADEIKVTFNFYIPLLDSDSAEIVPASTGDDATSLNKAEASASWTPKDTRDTPETLTEAGVCPACTPLHTLIDKSIAIQKGNSEVGGGDPAPGTVLEYAIPFQVSDYFAFDSLVVTDIISDGQHVDSTFTPTLTINGNGFSLSSQDFNSSNFDVACNYSPPGSPGAECTTDNTSIPNDGTTTLTFNVSDEMITRSPSTLGRMIGGCVKPSGGLSNPLCSSYDASTNPDGWNDGPTTGSITYRTVSCKNLRTPILLVMTVLIRVIN